MASAVEARVLVLRDQNPRWGPTRIVYELTREGVVRVPGRSSVYRALVRNGRIDPARRRRRRRDYKRWERGRPMELWQMDVVGGVHLCDGVEVKVVTGIDDNSRFVVSAKVVARATARPVCDALLGALHRYGVPEQVLTDNGKVFTGRFGPGGSSSEVLFDRVCVENGIRHLLTAPRSPTTTGKVERLHKTMRAEFFADADRVFATIGELQAADVVPLRCTICALVHVSARCALRIGDPGSLEPLSGRQVGSVPCRRMSASCRRFRAETSRTIPHA
jgi:transposase InsO family protein